MSEPAFTVRRHERAGDGSLPAEHLDRVREVLTGHGFVLLPSDTAYSIAAVPYSEVTRNTINALLQRPNKPVSLAFPDLPGALQWISPELVAEGLLEHYCPGPITVVCRASARGLPTRLFADTVAARNRTVGVRIPNSPVERQAAGCTPYPVTTVAVRDLETDEAVTSFEAACEIVRAGMAAIGHPTWCAVEGDGFYEQHSTVVEVTGDGTGLRLIRQGHIPFADIQNRARDLAAARKVHPA